MDDKKAIRIRHYCKSLKLPTWDVNDLTRYVSLYFDDPYSCLLYTSDAADEL